MNKNSQPVCIITGAANGIGSAVVQALLQDKYQLVLLDIDDNKLDLLAHELYTKYACKVDCYGVDLTAFDQVTTLIEKIATTYQSIDKLVCCAGIITICSFEKTSIHTLTDTFNLNTFGTFHVMQQVSKHMLKQRSGSIVCIGSNAATVPRINMAAYCASKAALHALTKCLALEVADKGIRCNIVSPGSTLTDMQTGLWKDSDGKQNTILFVKTKVTYLSINWGSL